MQEYIISQELFDSLKHLHDCSLCANSRSEELLYSLGRFSAIFENSIIRSIEHDSK